MVVVVVAAVTLGGGSCSCTGKVIVRGDFCPLFITQSSLLSLLLFVSPVGDVALPLGDIRHTSDALFRNFTSYGRDKLFLVGLQWRI